ncbi:HPr family phosphocarrier protein [Clostridium vitabionis]|jgi:phosphotransferase system HPr (HPr) family protein|uniref:HPr family phosphocarrier protein n=1 Tax=Clostridium vitabionis TaxID=2784388 RepID=UPI00188D8847|nr:HPr family phosphocarrier protein [Clostridium vitabionis]
MEARKVKIDSAKGQEARLAAMLVQVSSQYESSIHIEYGTKTVNAKSIMGMMSLGLKNGDEIEVTAEGSDAAEALDGIEKYLTNKKG